MISFPSQNVNKKVMAHYDIIPITKCKQKSYGSSASVLYNEIE